MQILEKNGKPFKLIADEGMKLSKNREFFVDIIYLGINDKVENYEEVGREIWKHFVEDNDTDFDILQEKIINNNLATILRMISRRSVISTI